MAEPNHLIFSATYKAVNEQTLLQESFIILSATYKAVNQFVEILINMAHFSAT